MLEEALLLLLSKINSNFQTALPESIVQAVTDVRIALDEQLGDDAQYYEVTVDSDYNIRIDNIADDSMLTVDQMDNAANDQEIILSIIDQVSSDISNNVAIKVDTIDG